MSCHAPPTLRVTTAIPVALFFFATNQKSFYIYVSLDESLQNNLKVWDRINHVAFFLLTVIGIIIGYVGASEAESGDPPNNVLLTDCKNDLGSKMMRVGFAMVLLLTFPPTFQVIRDQLMGMFYPRDRFDPYRATRGKDLLDIPFRDSEFIDGFSMSADTYAASEDNLMSLWFGRSHDGNSIGTGGSFDQQRRWNTHATTFFTWLAILLTAVVSNQVLNEITSVASSVISFVFVFFVVSSHSTLNARGQDAIDKSAICLIKNETPCVFCIPISRDDTLCRLKSGSYAADILIMWIFAFVLVGYFVSFSDNRVLMWITLGACGTYSFIYLAGQFGKNSNTFRSRLGHSLLLEHDMKGSAFRRSSLDG
jgi:hypothetical protein